MHQKKVVKILIEKNDDNDDARKLFFNINGFSFGTDRGYGEYQFLILCDENFRRW